MQIAVGTLYNGFKTARAALRTRQQADATSGGALVTGDSLWARTLANNIRVLELAMGRLEPQLSANPPLNSGGELPEGIAPLLAELTMALSAGWQQTANGLTAEIQRGGDVNGFNFSGPATQVADADELGRRFASLTAHRNAIHEGTASVEVIGEAQLFLLAALQVPRRDA